MYFGISAPFSSLSLFTPTITAGLGYSGLEAQLMTVPPYAVAYVVTLLVSWSADHFNARALHSAVFATIGAIGWWTSVRERVENLLMKTRLPRVRGPSASCILVTLRLPDRSSQRLLQLHSPVARLAKQQPILDRSGWVGDCHEHLVRCAGSDRRRVHLQGKREDQGLPDWSLDERCAFILRGGRVYGSAVLLQNAEPADTERRWNQDVQILSLRIASIKTRIMQENLPKRLPCSFY